jgi:integrase
VALHAKPAGVVALHSSAVYDTPISVLSVIVPHRILNEVFGKAISTNLLRHIYLTEHYKNIPAIADMQELARDMGHSSAQAMEDVKKK